jgi:ABC-type glutathione transport system ATPase component
MTDPAAGETTEPTTPPVLAVRGLGVRFSGLDAVRDVTLELAAGEVLGLVGESGSGKTTIARVATGFQAATTGAVELDGVVLGARRDRDQRRAVQMVFQDPYASLNPRRTVRSTFAELLRVHGIARSREAVAARSAELLELVGLPGSALDAFPGSFSGGQRQRIAIARALAVEPRVLVADEPTSALDVSVQRRVLDLLAELRERLDLTVLLITHDLGVVARLCDRVAVLRAGELVELADAPAFFAHPATDYARTLLDAAPRLDRSPAP